MAEFPNNAKQLAALASLLGLVTGLVWYWLKKRYGGDPEGYRPQQEAKRSPDWKGRPLSPAEWEALRKKGMSEREIAQVDKAARWAGRSEEDDPPPV
jgi:hypothetical protein